MTLQKVQPGDRFRFPAEAFNTIVELRDLQARSRVNRGNPGMPIRKSRGVEVKVRNDSYADRSQFEILGIDGVLLTPTDNEDSFRSEIYLKGIRPLSAAPFSGHLSGGFVILLEPIAAGDIGRALVSGVCPVKLDVTAETDAWADIIDNDPSMLRTSTSGAARVLWKESGTGTNLWGLVEFAILETPGPTYVKLDALWTETSAEDGSATATEQVWDDTTSAWIDSTASDADKTIYMPPWLTSWVVASGTVVEVGKHQQSGSWIVQEPIIEVRGVLDAQLNSGSSAAVSIWAGGSDTGENLTGYAPAVLASGNIASAKHVRMKFDRTAMHWEVVSAEC